MKFKNKTKNKENCKIFKVPYFQVLNGLTLLGQAVTSRIIVIMN